MRLLPSACRFPGLTFWSLLAGLMAGGAACHGQPGASPTPVFLIFDDLSYKHKPDLAPYGLEPIRAVSDFWPSGTTQDEVDEAAVRQAVVRAAQGFTGLLYIDLEHWPLMGRPTQEIARNLAKLERVAAITRENAPGRRIGYYSLLPERIYWPIIQKDAKVLAEWREASRLGEKLAEHVDVIFPSLYTFYNDEQGWLLYAEAMLTEARRHHKPVYAFLWPQFHDSNRQLKNTYIPAAFWRRELELCRRLADGIVLWGGWHNRGGSGQPPAWEQLEWDENAAWWIQTKEFIKASKGLPSQP